MLTDEMLATIQREHEREAARLQAAARARKQAVAPRGSLSPHGLRKFSLLSWASRTRPASA